MARWLTYLKERFPIPVYLLLVGGISLSTQLYGGGSLSPLAIAASVVGLFLFFAELRLMDEYKDYEKDVIAHPTRPLPRGVLGREEVRRVIHALSLGMLAFAAFVALVVNPTAGALYGLVTAYLWLMYKEFYVGDWLSARPIAYAVTHQIIMLPLCSFGVAIARPELALVATTQYLGVSMLGAFFAYEVCRKLDPAAHPILKTYLSMYKAAGTIALVIAVLLVAAWGDWQIGLSKLGWPAIVLLAATLPLLVVRPGKYKVVEGLATLSLLVHLWGPAVQRITGWPT